MKLKLKLKLELTDLSGRLSKLMTKAGVHRDIAFTHICKSIGTDGAIVLFGRRPPRDSDRKKEEEVVEEVEEEEVEDECGRED